MKLTIKIQQDEYPENPRTEWDNLGTMVCFHGRYNLGDEHDYRSNDYSGWEELEKELIEEEDPAAILPLYLYDHSGITMSTGPFSCPWDSGQVGFIFVSKEKARKEYGWKRFTKKRVEKLEEYLRNEVKVYDQYLTGDVWCFSIEDEDGEVVDSCCGFYGREDCEKQAEEAKEYAERERSENTGSLFEGCGAGI